MILVTSKAVLGIKHGLRSNYELACIPNMAEESGSFLNRGLIA